MKLLNDLTIQKNIPFFHTEKGEYAEFEFGDQHLYLDSNTLDLFECNPSELPAPIPVVPQFPFCPNRSVKMLSLNVTHQCQLRCDYCYVSHFYSEMNKMMTFETAKKAIDTQLDPKIIASEKVKIGFFGGEPLLNFNLIKEVVQYANSLGKFKFGMTTNCVSMTEEIAKFLADNNFSLIVSLDGKWHIHNLHRKYADGSDSFQDVIGGLRLLSRAGVKRITLRATFLPDCTKLLERATFLNNLCDEGLATGVSIEPVCLSEGCSGNVPEKLKFNTEFVLGLEKEYLEVAEYLAQRLREGKKARFHNIMVFVDRLRKKIPQPSSCGAGVGFLSISPDGSINSCHREMSSCIGHLEKGGIDERKRSRWVDNRYYESPSCTKCSYRNLCGGPCREHNITTSGNIHQCDPVSCAFYKIWMKSAVKVVKDTQGISFQQVQLVQSQDQQEKEKYIFLREAGGFGDILSMGGAAIQLKHEQPNSYITLCIPTDFVEEAKHLEGVDQVIGVGYVSQIMRIRRARGEQIDLDKHLYLVALPPDGKIVDMWCPGYQYEAATSDYPLKYTRSQIFAKAARCEDVSRAVPIWRTQKDEQIKASKYLKQTGEKITIGLSPRGTDDNRSLTLKQIKELVKELSDYNIIYLDCIAPKVNAKNVFYPMSCFIDSVALVQQCDILITVDSAFLHVGASLRIPTVGIFGMNDSHPYKRLYENLYVVENLNETVRCKVPCNRSTLKGYDVHHECIRQTDIQVDDIIKGVAKALSISFDPEFQKQRSLRMI